MPSNFQRWKNIMKCYPFEEKRLAKWEPPYIVQPKYDGVRCRAVPLDNGQYILLSSEENPIFSVPHINEALNKSGLTLELDGELYCHGKTFEQIVSITSRTVNLHPDHEDIKFHCFDVITSMDQMLRLKMVIELKKVNIEHLITTPFWSANNLEDVMKIYDHLMSQGYEGIIVRHHANLYIRKRSTLVMKFKAKKYDTYTIRGFKEELTNEGTPKGQLGALVCDSNNGETFSVGSGFREDQRVDLWKERDSLPGKTVRIGYQHMTSGRGVPRFPVFMEVIE